MLPGGLYELDVEDLATKSHSAITWASITLSLYNLGRIARALPPKVMMDRGLDFDRWYPKARQLAGATAFLATQPWDGPRLRKTLEKLGERFEVRGRVGCAARAGEKLGAKRSRRRSAMGRRRRRALCTGHLDDGDRGGRPINRQSDRSTSLVRPPSRNGEENLHRMTIRCERREVRQLLLCEGLEEVRSDLGLPEEKVAAGGAPYQIRAVATDLGRSTQRADAVGVKHRATPPGEVLDQRVEQLTMDPVLTHGPLAGRGTPTEAC